MPVDASDVTLAILTGRRPELLRRTLDALPESLLDTAHLVIFHNGGDQETIEVIDECKPDLKLTNLDGLWTIGKASSHLLAVAATEQRSFTAYVQDDWECRSNESWLYDAMRVLDNDPRIGQVRLRLASEKTYINDTSVTGEKVRWTYLNGYRISNEADWTLNPALMRTEDLLTSFQDEKDAMRQFHSTDKIIAQLTPGVFSHIGGKGQSLRIRADNERRHSRSR